ncbi:hypothetical protein [Novosphingobium sp. EMRT-2]|uniref:hypothetical protein n=1 Tax=Novosphingobium sp. EMRT-2 TaxID=2571749 RepID=UPI0010BE090D|nr:hypothetical protein [Novosphingobium sp. EMRT-2]QCI95979.1 hypothetical protein FA702_20350 [Novosphingobium sp. EMRT-2]
MNGASGHAHVRVAADVLLELSEDVEALGTRLCADANVIANHLRELQAIDLIGQQLRALSGLLGDAVSPGDTRFMIDIDMLASRFEGPAINQ